MIDDLEQQLESVESVNELAIVNDLKKKTLAFVEKVPELMEERDLLNNDIEDATNGLLAA